MQGGKYSSSGGDPPSGGLPQLVSQPGDAPAPGSAGPDERSSGASGQPGAQGEGGAPTQPRGGDSQHRQRAQEDPCDWDADQGKGGALGEHRWPNMLFAWQLLLLPLGSSWHLAQKGLYAALSAPRRALSEGCRVCGYTRKSAAAEHSWLA